MRGMTPREQWTREVPSPRGRGLGDYYQIILNYLLIR
jgi:hypothetical protein